MATKKSKPVSSAAAAADDNLDDLFSGIGHDAPAKKLPANPKSLPPAPSKLKPGDKDILADLESQLASELPSSRPHTPRLKDAAGLRRPTATPPAGEEKPPGLGRKSTDSARSLRATMTPSATSSDLYEADKRAPAEELDPSASQQGGWWGGILSTASAAMKQAEAAYKEIQQNEEAKKWADQVRGLKNIDVGTLKNYGDELRSRALPTFTNLLHTLAPPISSHERLLIHITHDFVGYPSLDPLVHNVFTRVMSQVEGGDLMVMQRGHESGARRPGDSSAGWRDGPWWRQSGPPRNLGLVKGLTEGTKLCRASAASYVDEYFASNGGFQQARTRATEDLSESNPVRVSDLFLAVQAIALDADPSLFARTASAEKERESSMVKEQEVADEVITFAILVLDPTHDIEFSTVSQAVPAKWVRWLEAPAPPMAGRGAGDDDEAERYLAEVPDDIKEMLDDDSLDPREWAAEWIEETLSLAVGIVAQRYVARRMGVGEGGLGRGKMRAEELVQDNAGEAARAGVI